MPILLQAKDFTDAYAYERRLTHREKHLDLLKSNYTNHRILLASAILDEANRMCGSIVIFNLSTCQEVEQILETEPYLQHHVWESYTLTHIAIPPFFLNKGSE